jgi:hypothetical protein
MAGDGLEMMGPPKPPGRHPGIKLDVLQKIIDDLDGNPTLKEIFGEPVTSKLAIIDNEGSLRLVEAGVVELTDEQKKTFEDTLKPIIDKYREQKQGD